MVSPFHRHTQHVWLIKTLFQLFWLNDIDPTLQERLSNILRRLIKSVKLP